LFKYDGDVNDLYFNYQNKKIERQQFQLLPAHGSGKHHSANWWKELAFILLNKGEDFN
jgi:superfamily II DNA helicase RecQ